MQFFIKNVFVVQLKNSGFIQEVFEKIYSQRRITMTTLNVAGANSRLISKLREKVEKKGILIVAANLGYKSQSTINKWFASNRIPDIAVGNVKRYLRGIK